MGILRVINSFSAESFIPDVLDELGDALCVSLRLELHALGLQEHLDVLVVGDNAVVHHNELVNIAGAVRVAVCVGRGSVGSPSKKGFA